jgi:hypothetical protein
MRDLLIREGQAKIIGVSESFKRDISESLSEMGACGYLLRNDDIKLMKSIILNVFQGKREIRREGLVPSLLVH